MQRDGVQRSLPRRALARLAAAALAAAEAPSPASISLILADDSELAALNQLHMGNPGPTDVLSFPLLAPSAYSAQPGKGETASPRAADFALPPGSRVHLGDVVVSVERAAAQADEGRGGQTGNVRWSVADELRLLVVHGVLHICGWDHAAPKEEAQMRALERRILDGA